MAWLIFATAGLAQSVGPEVLAEDLEHPTAVTVTTAADGGVRILVAESGAGRLTEFVLLGESLFGREVVATFDPREITALGAVGERRLLFGPDGLAAVTLGDEPASASEPNGPGVTGPPAINERWLFTPGEQTLLRARLAQGRVTALRPVEASQAAPLAVAISPEGYLAVLTGNERGQLHLRFHDPENTTTTAAEYPVSGLKEPIAIAYASGKLAGSALYALESSASEGEARGVSRIDVAFDGTTVGAVARRVATIDEATGMAMFPGGDAVVVTSDGERGRLLLVGLTGRESDEPNEEP